ncbi:MAG: hypothetical protein JXR83_07715 [Deltaproteobacteria bacterium]|nr:hypothetical protein [Deltaproteobacteria bacterium]
MDAATSRRQHFWAHAAAFGALWGALEVTFGSFLHSLRVPLSGAMLAALGAALLIAVRQIEPRRGSSLAIGLVAAACKSISPGGIIVGPMVAILAESLLVELALLARPRSAIAAALAGALAVSWTVSQKLISQVVFFGGDVIKLYLEMLAKIARSLRLDAAAGWWVLALVAAILVVIGSSAGLWGRRVGRLAQTARMADGAAA